jgi:hypothetical protein
LLLCAHSREKTHDETHGAKEIERERPFEVVNAVVRLRDASTNRDARIVDEDVDLTVLSEDGRDEALGVLCIRQVAGIDEGSLSHSAPELRRTPYLSTFSDLRQGV